MIVTGGLSEHLVDSQQNMAQDVFHVDVTICSMNSK